MFSIIKVVIVAALIFVFIKKRETINKILEKRIILNLLLFAVSLFIKNEKSEKINLKSRISKFVSEKLLFLDLWILNYRSNEKSEKLFVKEEKRNPKGPNC